MSRTFEKVMFPFPKEAIVCFLDGNKWCACRITFENVQESKL